MMLKMKTSTVLNMQFIGNIDVGGQTLMMLCNTKQDL